MLKAVTSTYLKKLRAVQPLARASLEKLDRTQPVEIDDTPPKRCRQCKKLLPATKDFFYPNPRTGRLKSPCKACIEEHRQKADSTKPCCVDGCDQPRHQSRTGRYYSRCEAHMEAYAQGRKQAVE